MSKNTKDNQIQSSKLNISAFIIGTILLLFFIAIATYSALFEKEFTETSIYLFRFVLPLVCASFALGLSGTITASSKLKSTQVRAGGTLAVFFIVFLFNPPIPLSKKSNNQLTSSNLTYSETQKTIKNTSENPTTKTSSNSENDNLDLKTSNLPALKKENETIKKDFIVDYFAQPLSNYWNLSNSNGIWGIDPQKGVHCSEVFDNWLILKEEYKPVNSEFSIEADIAVNNHDAGFIFENSNHFEGISLHYESDNINGVYFIPDERNVYNYKIEKNKYYNLKISVHNKSYDVYIDNQYLYSSPFILDYTNNLNIGLASIKADNLEKGNNYFKNFKLILS